MKYICYLFLIIFLIPKSFAQPLSKLKIAVYLEPPFVDFVNNEFVGKNITLVKTLAAAVNLEPEYIQCPFARCLSLVRSGQADMIVSVLKTETRQENMIYLTPAIFTQYLPIRFYLNTNSNIKINNYKDLSGLVVGTLRGASYFTKFDKDTSLNKVTVRSRKQLVGMLVKNRIDTFLEREETIVPLISDELYLTEIRLATYKYEKPVESFIAISKFSKIATYAQKLSNQLAKIVADKNNQQILKPGK